jgi:cathepsin L
LDNIIQNTANANPLKLTSDFGLSGTSLTSAMTSGSGNFTTQVIDWTVHAGKVRYQGVCGACYTFATSDAVASLYAIYKFGFFVALSTQQVVDCSSNGLTYGCNGGFLEGSYAYMQIKGIQTDVNYPYTSAISGMSGTCKR